MQKVKFPRSAVSLMRSGAVDGNCLRISPQKGDIHLQVGYSQDSTARGYIAIPASPKTLRSVAGALEGMAKAIDQAADEPDEIVIPEDYEPDEVVLPEEYLGHSTSDTPKTPYTGPLP
jgi:hypothetical protein